MEVKIFDYEEEEIEIEFPCLMSEKTSGLIVLVVSHPDAEGYIVIFLNGAFKGKTVHIIDEQLNEYNIFNGSIELKNS